MSLTWNFGSGSQSATPVNLPFSPWLYDAAYRVTQDSPNQSKLTDILAPLDMPTEIKISSEHIGNVYSTLANTKIPVSSQNANTSGTSVFVQLRTVANYTKTVGTTSADIQLPLEARLQLRLPNDANVTNAEIDILIGALIASLRNADGSSRIGEMLRGSLVPKEI